MGLQQLAQQIIDLYSFRAFKPALEDHSCPLASRLRGKTAAFLSLGDTGVTLGTVSFNKKGQGSFSDFRFTAGPVSEQLSPAIINELRKRTNCGAVIVSYGRTAEVQIINSAQRWPEPSLNETLVANPGALMGSQLNEKFVYSGYYHQSESSLLVASTPAEQIDVLVDSLAAAKLTPVRVQSSHLGLLNIALANVDARQGSRCVVVLDHGLAISVATHSGHWGNSRSVPVRSDAELRTLIEQVVFEQPVLLIATNNSSVKDIDSCLSGLDAIRLELPGINSLELSAYVAIQL